MQCVSLQSITSTLYRKGNRSLIPLKLLALNCERAVVLYTRDVNRAGNFGPARPANFFSGPARPGINLIQNWYSSLKTLLYL